MRLIERFFIFAVFVSLVAFLFLTAADAQILPDRYRFLELVDFANKPIADAAVNKDGFEQRTDKKGQLQKGLRIDYDYCQTNGFSVTKSGYFTFKDYFGLTEYDLSEPIKLELLIIPETAAERKAVGREQLKRELFAAAKTSDAAAVRKLLKSGLSANLTTSDLRGVPAEKNVPLVLFALSPSRIETVKELLAAGAEIRKKDAPAHGILLHYLRADPFSCEYPQTEDEKAKLMSRFDNGFDFLVEAGADVKATDAEGNTTLKIAVRKGYPGILKKLLVKGFGAQAKGEALADLAGYKDERDPPSLELANLLLKSGADPNFAVGNVDDGYTRCYTPLMRAGNAGKFTFVKLLLANKADINFTCKNGRTALIYALEDWKRETAEMLLEAGANGGGFTDFNKETALMIAANKGYIDIVKTLLARGFSVDAKDESGDTALIEATRTNIGGIEMVSLLLKAGADPNAVGGNCTTPLMYPAGFGNLDTIRLLLANKADVNLTCENDDAPIVFAARLGQVEAAKLLLDAGADVKGEQGRRALKAAGESLQKGVGKNKVEEIINLLKAAGAK